MHDLIIKNALLVDGTGRGPRHGAVAVDGGRISEVGDVALDGAAAAREVVDADGLALAPGIIDSHTHYDAQLTWDPYADPSPALGVTTVIIGNCGFTIAPCRPEARDLTMRNLTQVEGMSLDALRAGIRWDFETFPQFLAMLERRGVGPNVAAFVGHSSIRTFVMADDAPRRAATDDEIARMQAIVRDAMAAGAIGFASSTNEPHNGENGIPMPSRLADDREFRALVGAMGEGDRGVFMLTKGKATPIAQLEALAELSGRPVVVAAMLHSDVAPDEVFAETAEMARARRRGHVLYPQVSCTPLTMDFTLHEPYMFGELAAWKPALAADPAERRRLYGEPAFRDAVRRELRTGKQNLFTGQWDRVEVVEVRAPEHRACEGRNVAELAAADGKDPLDWILDLGLSEDLDTVFSALLLNANEAAVGRLLREPESNIALSDAGAHLTFLCDADFGLHLLGHWVRELGVLSLQEAVRRLTSQPAQIFGLPDRGRLAPGAAADLLLFDPATVGRGAKRRVFDLPAGAPRLTSSPVGVHGVWVNGVRLADAHGVTPNGAPPGAVLRGGAPVATA